MHGQRLRWHSVVYLGAVLLLGFAAAVPGRAQVSAPAPEGEGRGASLERVIGEVMATDPAAKKMAIKLDAGGTVTIILQDNTLYLRVPPGETDLKKAVKITSAEIGVGDRVYARGRVAEDQKSIPAMAVIVMTKSDLVQKRERERAEWQKQAVAGTVSALNAQTHEITLSVRSPAGTRTLIIEASEKTVFHRYAPDSVRIVQAKPSSFAELKVGDSLRILGEKNSDGTRIKPEEIVAGSFRNIPGIIGAIDAAASEIKITDLQSNKPLIVRITSDTIVRRLPPPAKASPATNQKKEGGSSTASGGQSSGAPPAANQKKEGGSGTASGGQSSGAPPAANQKKEGGSGTASGGQSSGAPPATNPKKEGSSGTVSGGRSSGPPTQGSGGGSGQMDVERMPVLKFSELKRDQAILVLCTVGVEPSRVTAIVVVAGIEPLLGPVLQDQTQVAGAWNFFDIKLP